MSYEHCDTHDREATNGCPDCVREEIVSEYGIAPHELDPLIDQLCAFLEQTRVAGLCPPVTDKCVRDIGGAAREVLVHRALGSCTEWREVLEPPKGARDGA